MEEYIRVSGKTLQDAILEASIQLGTTSDNIDYRIVERETRGFLGIGAKKAVIEARRRKTDEEFVDELLGEKKGNKKSQKSRHGEPAKTAREGSRESRRDNRDNKESRDGKPKSERKAKADRSEETAHKERSRSEGGARTGERADQDGAQRPAKEDRAKKKSGRTDRPVREKKVMDKEVMNKEETAPVQEAAEAAAAEGAAAAPKAQKEAAPRRTREERSKQPADPQECIRRAEEFLADVFGAMDIEVRTSCTFENNTLSVDISGDDMGILIGKRGQTLDSLQYLTSLVVNKGNAAYVRVKLDTENYRERRKETLENLARNMANKARKTRRPVYLEPMNPNERRIIHSALQDDPYVTTHSEGDEPLRKVVITLKKRDYDTDSEEE